MGLLKWAKDEGVLAVTQDEIANLRAMFLHYLTQDSATKDRRRRAFNQAIFNAEKGWAVWSNTDLDMVLSKFDKAAATIRRDARSQRMKGATK